MDFKTTSYFFPANCHRMKKTKIDSSILSVYRKSIKTHLSCFVTTQQPPSRPSTTTNPLKIRRYTAMSLGKFQPTKPPKKTPFTQDDPQRLPNQTLGIFKLLQNARKLQKEQQAMKNNPFYKIQKKRMLKAKLNPKITEQVGNTKQKGLKSRQSLQCLQVQQQLFHNQSRSKLVQEEANTRTKSQTVTYYEIKSYYEEKYGNKLTEERQADGQD